MSRNDQSAAFDKVRAKLDAATLGMHQQERVHQTAGKILGAAFLFFAVIYGVERYILHGAADECKVVPISLNCVLGTMHSATSIQWAETVLAGIVGGAIAMYFGRGNSNH